MPAFSELSLYNSIRKPVQLLQGAFLSGLAGILLLQGHTVSVLVCWLLVLFACLGITKSLLCLLDRRPCLSISASGISGSATHNRFISWSRVKEARLQQVSGQQWVVLVLEEEMGLARKVKIEIETGNLQPAVTWLRKLKLAPPPVNIGHLATLLQSGKATAPENLSAAATIPSAPLSQHATSERQPEPEQLLKLQESLR